MSTIKSIRKKNDKRFLIVFGVPLSQFWDDNRGGFKMAAFITQVLEYEGPNPETVCAKKFGVVGIMLIQKILQDTAEYWTIPF